MTIGLPILGLTKAQAQIGGVPVWTNRYNGPANDDDLGRALAVDGSGNVFVTGYSYDQNAGGSFNPNFATIKYSGAGVALWTNRYSGSEPRGIAVDGSGKVFVTGYSTGSSSGYDYATIAYSGAGVPLWTNRYNGPENSDDEAFAVAVDGRGNVFVTGHSYGTNGYADYVTIKYSSAIPPSLAVGRTATNTVVVSWPSPSTGLTLQQSANGVATLNWTN
ncbi:MAG: SBBP repeat-containing protein, partial [Limisphaerales bacterium]